MLRSVISRGWPPSWIAAFSAGRPNASQPIGRSTRPAGAAAEVREDVAHRVVEDVPHVQPCRTGTAASRAGTSALVGALAGRGSGCGRPARPPRRAATSPRSSSGRTRSITRPPGTKKPLVREAVGSWRGLRRVGFLRYGRSSVPDIAHNLASGTDPAIACSSSFPKRARRGRRPLARRARASELAERFGTPLVVYCEETLRARARALPAGGARGARRLRHEGVPERRA